jgi:hypothetical protein
VIISNNMTTLLKIKHHGVIAWLCSLDVQTSRPFSLVELQKFIHNHSKVFWDIPKGLPLVIDHYHAINFQPISVTPNNGPYMYWYAQKSDIGHMIEEMLEVGIVQPRQSVFYSPVVMVQKLKVHGICVQIIDNSTKWPLKISFMFLSLVNY